MDNTSASNPNDRFGQIDDVTVATDQYIKHHYGRAAAIIFVALLSAVIVVWYAVTSNDSNVYKFLIIPIGIILFCYRFIKSEAEHSFMAQFAAQNNFSYQKKAVYDTVGASSAYLSHVGRNPFFQDLISGVYNGENIRLYNFTATVGSGKSRHQIEFTVFEMQYAGQVPDFILDSNIHKFGMLITSSFPGKKKLSLEGDFDKYFSVYISDNYQIETLEILTPDTMQELIEKSPSFSFEFSNNKLFIYNRKLITKKEDLVAMYDFSRTLVVKLAPVLATIKTVV